jgi:hydrogenase maturation protease
VLVAGVGNIFLGDDGFGVEVAGRLSGVPVPDGVEVKDFGIRGVHLAYQLLDGYDTLVLIDAVQRGDTPGTLSVIEPELEDSDSGRRSPVAVDAHSMDPTSVLEMLAGLGGRVGQVLVVACEAERLDEEIGLSEPVSRAVPGAVELVMELVEEICSAKVGVGTSAGPSRSEQKRETGT